ncbi:hypothetical protein ES705_14814 [subsurface metagenome]
MNDKEKNESFNNFRNKRIHNKNKNQKIIGLAENESIDLHFLIIDKIRELLRDPNLPEEEKEIRGMEISIESIIWSANNYYEAFGMIEELGDQYKQAWKDAHQAPE